MKIEILFPEVCNLFGDVSNMHYLKKCLPEAEFISTPLDAAPIFATENVDMIYMGPMTEHTQEAVIKKFLPLADRIKELIDGGTTFLFTGNAMEVLGSHIEKEDGSKLDGLDIIPMWAKRDMMHRHNSTFLGKFGDYEVMGFKSQFTMAYPHPGAQGLFQRTKGVGLNRKCKFEGLRVNNFFGTYLLGPVLILNPEFTKHFISCMGVADPQLAFPEEMQAAYDVRLKDFHAKG